MNIILFEDVSFEQFEPVSLLRPLYDIKTGVFSNAERLKYIAGNKNNIGFFCRPELSLLLREKHNVAVNGLQKENTFFINGRIILFQKAFEKIFEIEEECKLTYNDILVAAYSKNNPVKKDSFIIDINYFGSIPEINIETLGLEENKDFLVLNYIWDVMRYFENTLKADIELLFKFHKTNIYEKADAFFINKSDVYINDKSLIFPGSVLDADGGKVFIDEDSVIEPFTYIKGPAYIGKKVIIKSGTKIYGPVMAGFNSRLSGELSGTIFHSFVNKQHDGFIGNSYICEFVNLGADTVTSNLKNNYSIIKTRYRPDSPQINTGMQFLGSIIGDHAKTGINTMLNTGSVIGIFVLIAGGGFPDKFINNFSWYITGSKPKIYNVDDALSTAKMVMSRRDVNLSPEYENLVRNIFERIKQSA